MPSSSQMKKEEAELRKIAKHARLSRKEEAAKERQRERRGRSVVEPTAAATSGSSRRRRGALILPAEVEELRRRLLLADDAPGAAASGGAAGSGVKAAEGTRKQRTKRPRTAPAAASASRGPRLEEPPYGMEVHHKKKQIIVTVTLHHVPSAHVDVSETTDERLVVDTSKHTKKYRLELPIPDGMRVNAEAAEYEMDADMGVLTCVLPIRGDVAASLQAERAKMLDDIRRQKSLRFRIGADGELKVRSRRALLAKNERAQAALMQEERGEREQLEPEAVVAKEAREEEKEAAAVTAAAGAAGTRKAQKARKEAAPEEDEEPPKKRSKKETAPASRGGTAKEQDSQKGNGASKKQPERQPPRSTAAQKAAAGGVFDEEHKKAMEIAKSAGKAARMTLRQGIAHAKALQKKIQERLSLRSSRRSLRSERTQDSFARILEEQKRQLLARAELNASIAASEKKAGAGRKGSGKTVTFAAAEE
ncbi:uncharacterized protein Tco025E_05888 [Trypanosoma conorhini]|uniref:Uncharacterized protein n=1 Tax=Trypanosoma conorhini TaxID=83891 RepID=A0A422P9F8_9TRYP|nr:uncharacterized protein Tco025E_05888 [Trypanosoma conorhini]RNF14320.1 hypothetical protein Tco025E_05888 [Trypanosoma conorhini]